MKNNEQRRILLVSHGWPLEKYGGVGLYVQMLVHEFFAMGHLVFLLTPSESTKFAIHKTTYEWGTHISLEQPPISRYSQTWKWPQRDDYIENIVRGIAPDIVHLHHLDRLGLCVWEQRLRDITILYTLHDYASICSRGQLYDPRRNMICNGPRVYECATCLQFELHHNPITNFIQKWLPLNVEELKSLSTQIPNISILHRIRMYQRISQSRRLLHNVFTISPSLNLQRRFVERGFTNAFYLELPLLRDLPKEKPSKSSKGFLFAGSLIESKGLDLLLKAFEPFIDHRLTIAGSGPLQKRQQVYPQYNWLGHVKHNEMLKIMAEHHTIILPSLWPENAPISLREAAALGLQIICTSGGGEELSKHSIVVDRTIESLRDGIQLAINKRKKQATQIAPKMLHRRQHCEQLISYYDFCLEQNSIKN